MVQNVKHQILISEKLNFDLFFLWSWFNERGCLFVDGNIGDFTFGFSASNDEELFDIRWDGDKIFNFILTDGFRIWCILFRIEVYQDTIDGAFSLHGIFVIIVLFIFDHVKGLFLSIVLVLIFSILFESHIFLFFFNTITSGLHDFESGFIDFEIFSFWISFVFLEFLFHCLSEELILLLFEIFILLTAYD